MGTIGYGSTYAEAVADAQSNLMMERAATGTVKSGASIFLIVLTAVLGLFVLSYQLIKRPLAGMTAIAVMCVPPFLFAVWMTAKGPGYDPGLPLMLLFVVLGLLWFGMLLGFCLVAKQIFLFVEVWEAQIMAYVYNRHILAGRVLHVALYVANAVAAGFVAYGLWLFVFVDPNGLIYRTLGELGPNQIAPEVAAVVAAIFCCVVRYRNHPFASRLTVSGEVRTQAAS